MCLAVAPVSGVENELLDIENETIEAASDEQELYEELYKLTQSMNNDEIEPEKEKESRVDMNLKVERFKKILLMENKIQKKMKEKIAEMKIREEKLREEKDKFEAVKKKANDDKAECPECVKRAEVEQNQDKLLDKKDKDLDSLKKELKNAKERNIVILKECKKKKKTTTEMEKEKNKLVDELQKLRESNNKVIKEKNNLKTELETKQAIIDAMKELNEVNNTESSKQKDLSEKTPSDMTVIENDVECNQCERFFKNKCDLENHKEAKHRILECPLCSEAFTSTSIFTSHINQCMNSDISTSCSECDKKLTTQYQMKTHLKCHNICNDYSCHVCGMMIKKANIINKHTKEHHVEEKVPSKEICKFWRLGKCKKAKMFFQSCWKTTNATAVLTNQALEKSVQEPERLYMVG